MIEMFKEYTMVTVVDENGNIALQGETVDTYVWGNQIELWDEDGMVSMSFDLDEVERTENGNVFKAGGYEIHFA